jgi:mono/diheme cytochrome c family protein
LIAFLRAGLPKVPTAEAPPITQGQGAAVEGSAQYVRYGCINCHGPNGLGGVPNPLSPDKSIPPLSGQDFRHEFNTDAKIAAVIETGSVIGRAPIVSMPHWGGIIPAAQLRALIAYLKTLK